MSNATAGRIVHYVLGHPRGNMGVVRPAVVLYPLTADGRVKLRVFADDDPGDFLPHESISSGSFAVEAAFDEGNQYNVIGASYPAGTWHWPPRT